MAELRLVCESCGDPFVWTEKEQKDSGLDDGASGGLVDIEPFCRACRPKQDHKRN